MLWAMICTLRQGVMQGERHKSPAGRETGGQALRANALFFLLEDPNGFAVPELNPKGEPRPK